jgi:hypothetical protein
MTNKVQQCRIIYCSLASAHVSSDIFARNTCSSQGTINYPTLLYLVGHFRILYLDAPKREYQIRHKTFNCYKHDNCTVQTNILNSDWNIGPFYTSRRLCKEKAKEIRDKEFISISLAGDLHATLTVCPSN